ncbi:MAG: hypothetical protein D6781_00290 [Verrucomicrobia bacterium]|nr:MAG: hypothetical protein D6781_00290 [Verrucomicrobiota bacterium]
MGLFEGGRSPADAFDFYPGRFLVPEGQPPGRLVPQLPVIGGPGEALSLFRWHFLTAFGRVDRERVALGERRGVIEVRRVIGGEALLEQEVPGSPGPEWPDWRPFEMLVLVGKDGVIGEPLVVPVGPGTAAVEGFFRRYVRTGLRLDLRVGPGYYRILIGP